MLGGYLIGNTLLGLNEARHLSCFFFIKGLTYEIKVAYKKHRFLKILLIPKAFQSISNAT